jgi:ABC-type uncharacterized transport system involved in gliding motility auxiliary subunit
MKPISRRIYAVVSIALAAVVFVALNIAVDASLTTERVDLTANGVYTLADGTKHILADLREPITLRFFYSKKTAADYAQISSYAARVRDLLDEYRAFSHGKIIVEEIDPEPYTPAEDQASADGLTGAPTDSGDLVYFGLVGTNTIDGKEAVPFFAQEREPYLEYDITSLIYRLSTPKKPVVGIVSSLPLESGAGGMEAMMQGRSQPFMIYEELSRTYATKMLDAGFDKIPSDVDVLMIVHPLSLTAAQDYAIDQFVLKGGRALVFVDPMSELASQGQGMSEGGGPSSSDLPPLFKAWGIGYNPDKVVADRELAQSVQASMDPRNPVVRYPVWLHLGSGNFDGKDQITANLQSLNLASVGALFPRKGATTAFSPLVTSSSEASLLDAPLVKLSPRPQDLMAQVRPTGEHYVVAARITGPAKTAFPAGPPGVPATGLKNVHQLKVSTGPINVVVMADTDIFDDRFWVREDNLYGRRIAAPFADNGAFVLNAVENLTGSSDLISLRTRATNDRPFVVVQQLQAKAQAQFQQEAQALQQRVSDTESRLHALEQGGTASGQASGTTQLSPEQQAAIEGFKRELVETRGALRDVQHNLRKEVDALGAFLTFVNIWLVPLLVAILAVGVALLRRRRRARALALRA